MDLKIPDPMAYKNAKQGLKIQGREASDAQIEMDKMGHQFLGLGSSRNLKLNVGLECRSLR